MTLDRYALKLARLDISESTTITQPTDIAGFEIIAVITPTALDDALNDIDQIEIDPGNGIFYEPLDNDGGGLLATWFTNMGVDQYLSLPIEVTDNGGAEDGPRKLVGARARLVLSAAEDADRDFFLVLLAL